MGGEGSMAAMNASLKQNRNLAKVRRSKFKEERKEIRTSNYNKALRVKRISQVKLEKLRRSLLEERRKERIRAMLILAFSTVLVVMALILFRNYYLA